MIANNILKKLISIKILIPAKINLGEKKLEELLEA